MIESVLLTNKVTSQTILIDKGYSDFVLDEVDFGVIQGRHHSYSYVGQIGAHIESTSLETRQPSITGWVIGRTYEILESNKAILNGLINPQQEIQAQILNQYVITFRPDYTIKYSAAYQENNEILCRFLIQGTCADPTFTTLERDTPIIASVYPKFKFPLIIPEDTGIILGLRESSLLATIQNRGNLSTGVEVIFTCTSSVTNPKLINISTQEFIKVDKVLTPGEKIIVSTRDGNKYIRGVVNGVEYNYFRYMDLESTWLQLQPGKNVFTYEADVNPGGLEIELSFSPRFLEVQ